MKKFKIYGFSITNQKVLITNSESISLAATFEEQLKLQQYMKADFSFKISDTIENGTKNPFISLIYPGGKIRLELINKTLDFIITNISSEFYKDIIVYNVSMQDYASYVYSKQGINLYIDYTGDLPQLIREVIWKSNKNFGYKFANQNYLNMGAYTYISNATVTSSTYITEYIGLSTVVFPKVKLFDKDEYIFRFYVKSMSAGAQFGFGITGEFDVMFYTDISLGWNEVVFEYPSGANSFQVSCITEVEGLVSISDIDLLYNIHQGVNQNYIDNSLHLAGDSTNDSSTFNKENFRTALYENLTGSESYYKKATLILNASNLYNGLIEIAKIYNSEIQFNYEENTVNFINKDIDSKYKGYRLSPLFNLLSLSREEDFGEFSSILRVSGQENLNLVPNIPVEFQQYFYDCVSNDFTGNDYFENYGASIGEEFLNYKYVAQNYVYDYIVDDENKIIRQSEINDFAAAADLVPHLENAIYGLDYYKNTGKITDTLYNNFYNIINNDLRKLNIKSRIYSNLFYNNETEISKIQNNIDFISGNLGVESYRQYEMAQKYDYITVSAGVAGTNYWTVNKVIGNGSSSNAVPIIPFSGDSGTSPYYINTSDKIYYGKYIDSTHIQIYEDQNLTTIVSIPANYSKTWYLYRSIIWNSVSGPVLLANYNQYASSLLKIKEYKQSLYEAYSLNYNTSLVPTGINVDSANNMPELNTFTYYVLKNQGFNNGFWDGSMQTGGIHDLYSDINNKIYEIKNLNTQRQDRISAIEVLLAGSIDIYQKSLYEQEKAGLEAAIKYSKYEIGDSTTSPTITGSLNYQAQCLFAILSTLSDSEYIGPTSPNFIESIDGLQNKLDILSSQKQILINNLYNDYENYIVEGYYENTEEIYSNSLLEQALTIFYLSQYPKINYGVSIIDISALENHEYIDINIWDKILIQEPEPRLYKTYINEAKYLEVFEINTSLRKPEETQLTVSQEDEIKRILQKLLFRI